MGKALEQVGIQHQVDRVNQKQEIAVQNSEKQEQLFRGVPVSSLAESLFQKHFSRILNLVDLKCL